MFGHGMNNFMFIRQNLVIMRIDSRQYSGLYQGSYYIRVIFNQESNSNMRYNIVIGQL